jgi:hypothetical protein
MRMLSGHTPVRRRVPGSGTWSNDVASRKRRANELMRRGLRQFDPTEPIPFFCECQDPGCYQAVWLTGSEYEERRDDPSRRLVVRAHDDIRTR